MKKFEVVEAEIIDNKIIQERLQMLEVRMPDGRIHKEYYLTQNKRVRVVVDDIRFKIGGIIGVKLNLGHHSKEHIYDRPASNIEKIIIPE